MRKTDKVAAVLLVVAMLAFMCWIERDGSWERHRYGTPHEDTTCTCTDCGCTGCAGEN